MLKIFQKKLLAVIISAPSGGGKSSVTKALLAKDKNLAMFISATTRKPRPGDVEGKDYFFKSRNEFLKMIREDELLEYSTIYGNLYGIPKSFIKMQLQQKNNIIFNINNQGAGKLKSFLQSSVITIFILPPSIKELRKRLELRNQDTSREIELRLNLAVEEIKEAESYDYVVINQDFLTTVNKIYELIKTERKIRGL